MAQDDAPARQETEEERQARKERDRQRQKKHAERDKGKAPADAKPELKAAKGGLPPLGEGENRLHRDTPFLCDFRFHTPLPPPPIGPKLLPVAVDRSRMTAYKPYNLWWERPHELPLEMSLGMSLDPLDVEAYRAPPVAPPLDPADEALLAPLDTGLPLSSGPGFRVGKHKGKNKAGWLMRTLYLSDMQLPKGNADENAHARQLRERQLAEEGIGGAGRDPRAEQAAAIDASFAAVLGPPVHATNPALTPVEVLPVLPDFDRWPDAYVHLQFDQDPLVEVPYVNAPDADAALRDAALRGAFMKSYAIGAEGAPPEKIIVYFAPTEAEARASAEAAAGGAGPSSDAADGGAREAEWVREYVYETRDEGQLLVFFFGPQGASYVPIHKRVGLRRRAARTRDGGAQDVARPSRVTLRRRKRTEEEEEVAAAAKRALTAPEAEEDEDAERPPTPLGDVDDDDEAVAGAATAKMQQTLFGDDSDDE